MGIRETINRRPYPVLAGAGVAIVIAISVCVAGWRSQGTAPATAAKYAYFSDDDGRTFFRDSGDKVAPFDYGGKEAVAAHVFACNNGTKFVGYLERAQSAKARDEIEKARRAMIEAAARMAVPMPDSELVDQIRNNTEVKRPGEKAWIAANSPKSARVFAVTCPDGHPATEVTP